MINGDQQIENLADDLRLKIGIPDDERLDMTDVLRRMRIAGLIKDFERLVDNAADGSEAQFDPQGNRILLSDSLAHAPNTPRGRFTIAHEIGHRMGNHEHLRHRKGSGRSQFGKQVQKDEAFANRFAAAFLIPKRLAGVDQNTTADDLVQRFGVSRFVAERRLLVLQRQFRQERGIARTLPVRRSSKSLMVDTGDYNETFPEMLRNAIRWNKT